MNKKLIISIFFFSILTTTLTSFYSAHVNANLIRTQLTQSLKQVTKNHLNNLTASIRNNIIMGDIRGARVTLEEMINTGFLAGYDIIRDDNIYESNSNFQSDSFIMLSVDIYFSDFGEKWGSIVYYIQSKDIARTVNKTESLFVSAFVFSTLCTLILFSLLFAFFLYSDSQLVALIEKYFKYDFNLTTPAILKLGWQPLIKRIRTASEESYKYKEKLIETENIKTLNKISRQVSHDIRSPLAALNVALEDVANLPEKNRVILKMAIQRIQDIANNLLKNTLEEDQLSLNTTFIYPAIEEILSEKRLEYKSNPHISIQGEIENSAELFVKVNMIVLKQVISNLINNSVEAIDKEKGLIILKLLRENNYVIIKISDNGKGIPPEILRHLGKKSISYGKKGSSSGHGIGVKHAFDIIESWDGIINYYSTLGRGTNIIIKLPSATAPSWFIKEISTTLSQKIIILDDDKEIHQVWMKKFEKSPVEILHFFNTSDARHWILSNTNESFLFLSDYELINDDITGLDLIKELRIIDKSILVTSHYEEVLKMETNIRIIPKSVVSNIKINELIY